MKVVDLIGPALDWAVAKCESVEYRFRVSGDGDGGQFNANFWWETRRYSTDPAQAHPIIERERIDVNAYRTSLGWYARMQHGHVDGPTPLIAAMRCYVASKLGDEIEVPFELALSEKP